MHVLYGSGRKMTLVIIILLLVPSAVLSAAHNDATAVFGVY